jgi:hypothetical protein
LNEAIIRDEGVKFLRLSTSIISVNSYIIYHGNSHILLDRGEKGKKKIKKQKSMHIFGLTHPNSRI